MDELENGWRLSVSGNREGKTTQLITRRFLTRRKLEEKLEFQMGNLSRGCREGKGKG